MDSEALEASMGGRSQQRSPMQVLVDIEGPGSSFQQDAIDYFCHAQLASQVCIPCTPHHLLCVLAVISAQTPRFQSSLHMLCFISHFNMNIVVANWAVLATRGTTMGVSSPCLQMQLALHSCLRRQTPEGSKLWLYKVTFVLQWVPKM